MVTLNCKVSHSHKFASKLNAQIKYVMYSKRLAFMTAALEQIFLNVAVISPPCDRKRRRRIARNRWFVALTLYRNPGLANQRKHRLRDAKQRRAIEAASNGVIGFALHQFLGNSIDRNLSRHAGISNASCALTEWTSHSIRIIGSHYNSLASLAIPIIIWHKWILRKVLLRHRNATSNGTKKVDCTVTHVADAGPELVSK